MKGHNHKISTTTMSPLRPLREDIISNVNQMKPIFASKTIWFGILQVIFAGIGYFTAWIDPQTAYSLFITGLATIGLRVNTTQPIG